MWQLSNERNQILKCSHYVPAVIPEFEHRLVIETCFLPQVLVPANTDAVPLLGCCRELAVALFSLS
jgi:hypothetical protein